MEVNKKIKDLVNLKKSNLRYITDLLQTHNLHELKQAVEVQKSINRELQAFLEAGEILPETDDISISPEGDSSFVSVTASKQDKSVDLEWRRNLFKKRALELFPSSTESHCDLLENSLQQFITRENENFRPSQEQLNGVSRQKKYEDFFPPRPDSNPRPIVFQKLPLDIEHGVKLHSESVFVKDLEEEVQSEITPRQEESLLFNYEPISLGKETPSTSTQEVYTNDDFDDIYSPYF